MSIRPRSDHKLTSGRGPSWLRIKRMALAGHSLSLGWILPFLIWWTVVSGKEWYVCWLGIWKMVPASFSLSLGRTFPCRLWCQGRNDIHWDDRWTSFGWEVPLTTLMCPMDQLRGKKLLPRFFSFIMVFMMKISRYHHPSQFRIDNVLFSAMSMGARVVCSKTDHRMRQI